MKGSEPLPQRRYRIPWLVIGGAALLAGLLLPSGGKAAKSLPYSEWDAKVTAGKVDTATISPSGKVTGELADGTRYRSGIPAALNDQALADRLREHSVTVEAVADAKGVWSVLGAVLPFVLIGAAWVWLSRGSRQMAGGFAGFGASKAKVYDEQRPTTRFSDVAGYEGAKREIAEIVDFLARPERYAAAGAKGPRGVLMLGPPGTGKTLLARAVAGEAGVPFLALTGSSFVEMFVGVGAARVRDLFAAAHKQAPAIIFIDEIDAIGERRGRAVVSNDEREQTLNQLLFEMDGFEQGAGVVVLAATNRPEVLDPALLRPGRFDRQVEIPLPTLRERAAILAVHAAGKHLGSDVDLDVVARATPGFSGADLANLLNEAAIVAVRDDRSVLSAADLDEARDRVRLGRSDAANALRPDERRAVAVHESGHALVAALAERADPVAKVTILPRGGTLGVTEQLPEDERHLFGEAYLHDALAVRLGGRAAEQIVFDEVSSGAANDLAEATRLAVRMVRDYGMSDRLGPVGFSPGGPMYLGTEPVRTRDYAEATQQVIDEEVGRLLREAEARAAALLRGHRPALDRLVESLLARETLDGDDVLAVIAADDLVLSTGPGTSG